VKHVSTRGNSPPISFDEIVLSGLAPDGGLYVPETYPAFSANELTALRGLPYAKVAARVLRKFAGPNTALEIETAVHEAYATFRHPEIAPLRHLEAKVWLLELFHGPTFAFKDFALQVLGRLIAQRLAQTGERRVIVAATSGDTGSAAIAALAKRPGIDIVVLHPRNRVSEIQRRQMTTVDAANVHNIALEGDFDDAQALVKAMFNDKAFSAEVPLGAVNSINWARLAIQTTYFVTASLALDREGPVSFSVPTGNFGDIYSGYAAKRLGAPVGKLIACTNSNDIVARAINSGRYVPKPVTRTSSPSMDIQVASNFERLLFEAGGRDAPAVVSMMDELARTGGFTIPARTHQAITKDFSGHQQEERDNAHYISEVFDRFGIVIDPHTATAVPDVYEPWDESLIPETRVILSTAHPAKFREAVERGIGKPLELPVEFQRIMKLPEKYTVLPNDLREVQAFIRARTVAKSGG
jgi:threonine synthase